MEMLEVCGNDGRGYNGRCKGLKVSGRFQKASGELLKCSKIFEEVGRSSMGFEVVRKGWRLFRRIIWNFLEELRIWCLMLPG